MTDIEDLEDQIKIMLYHYKYKRAHFCWEWDGLFIDNDMKEMEVCLCYPKEDD